MLRTNRCTGPVPAFLALAAAMPPAGTDPARAADNLADVRREITARHDEAIWPRSEERSRP